ncbi:ParB N-terminal domain-containing protein [Nocardiopsis sp. NPDC006198]|uniref:ParB N-terminal domain-containing protein n=1 Tax=Nocardiopsis sp. NPDC006198 TaxID=3154472 RepID=UPI00339EEF21
MQTLNPLGLDTIDATGYITGQHDLDADHVNEIAASMETDGWQGAPLVVLGDYARAYTGTHRLAAAEQAGLDEVPAVELADLFQACNLDLWEICDGQGLSVLEDRPQIVELLPADVRSAYGLEDLC